MHTLHHRHGPSMVAWTALIIAVIALAIAWDGRREGLLEDDLENRLQLGLPTTTTEDKNQIDEQISSLQTSLDASVDFDTLATAVAELRTTLDERGEGLFGVNERSTWDEQLQWVGDRLRDGTSEARDELRALLADIQTRLGD